MLVRLRAYEEVVMTLLNAGYVVKALSFASNFGINSLKNDTLMDIITQLQNKKMSEKAEELVRRMAEIKKVDESRLKLDKNYKPLIVEE